MGERRREGLLSLRTELPILVFVLAWPWENEFDYEHLKLQFSILKEGIMLLFGVEISAISIFGMSPEGLGGKFEI